MYRGYTGLGLRFLGLGSTGRGLQVWVFRMVSEAYVAPHPERCTSSGFLNFKSSPQMCGCRAGRQEPGHLRLQGHAVSYRGRKKDK